MSTQELQGIIPPLVTPFTEDGDIDEALHRAEVNYMIEKAGVHGLSVCGSTGEGYTLTTDECRTVTAWTVEEARGRVPVIGAVIADSTKAAIRRAKAIADLGIAAIQVAPTHYVYRPDDDATVRYFAAIVEAAKLPLVIDNVVPWYHLSPELLARALDDIDGVIGVKQGGANIRPLADLLMRIDEAGFRKTVRVLSAVNPLLYPSLTLGAHGAAAAISTAVPDWCVGLWNAVHQGAADETLTWHKRLLGMWNAIEGENLPANVKAAMWLQKRKAGFPRAPIPISPPARRGKIRAVLGLR
ncbi:MAG: dihydrodipicolinate synthase family protein [bacterium]|nr:dihydrodipicolinate synthase family protein [bacterium]